MASGSIKVSITREGIKLSELKRILKKHSSPTHLRTAIQRTNKRILKDPAQALRNEAKNQNRHEKRRPRGESLASKIRVKESKRDKFGTGIIVWDKVGQFLQSGTKQRRGPRGRLTPNAWATKIYDRWLPRIRRKIRIEYTKIFTKSIKSNIERTRGRERVV